MLLQKGQILNLDIDSELRDEHKHLWFSLMEKILLLLDYLFICEQFDIYFNYLSFRLENYKEISNTGNILAHTLKNFLGIWQGNLCSG